MITLQVPLIVIILFNIGLLKLNNLTLLRKAVLVLSVVFGAVATPTVDVFSQMLVAVPFYLLFEIALQYCIFKQRFWKQRPVAWHAAPLNAAPRRAKRAPVKATARHTAARAAVVNQTTPDPEVSPSIPPAQSPGPTDSVNPL